jgi:hypothetical protein
LSLKSDEKASYDVLGADMYAVGVVFLIMKFLIPENGRTE